MLDIIPRSAFPLVANRDTSPVQQAPLFNAAIAVGHSLRKTMTLAKRRAFGEPGFRSH